MVLDADLDSTLFSRNFLVFFWQSQREINPRNHHQSDYLTQAKLILPDSALMFGGSNVVLFFSTQIYRFIWKKRPNDSKKNVSKVWALKGKRAGEPWTIWDVDGCGMGG